MEENYVRQKAEEALKAIMAGVGLNVYYSWGVSRVGCSEYRGMPTLMLKVNGLIHTGEVFVSLNEGVDLYEVRLIKNGEVVKTVDDVFFDQLGWVIDINVERDSSLTNEEYYKQAMADSYAKL